MRRELRLRANADFQRVRNVGKSVANPLLVLLQAPNPSGQSRFGFAVGKKVGGAVERNRVKRRLREQVRLHHQAGHLRSGVDVVVIARPAACDATYETLSRALDELLGRARLLNQERR